MNSGLKKRKPCKNIAYPNTKETSDFFTCIKTSSMITKEMCFHRQNANLGNCKTTCMFNLGEIRRKEKRRIAHENRIERDAKRKLAEKTKKETEECLRRVLGVPERPTGHTEGFDAIECARWLKQGVHNYLERKQSFSGD